MGGTRRTRVTAGGSPVASRLAQLLAEHGTAPDGAQHQLCHEVLVAAPPTKVWHGLARLTLSDLPLARMFAKVRYVGVAAQLPQRPLLSAGPLPLMHFEPPVIAVAAGASQPWLRHPRRHQAVSLADWCAFDEPDWVKVLLAFEIEDQGGSGSLLRSRTLVWPTSRAACRRFTGYWAGIRPFAALMRREMLVVTARLALGPSGFA